MHVEEAYEQICGLCGYQIRGVAALNLPKDQAMQLVSECHLEALKLGVPLEASLKHKYKNGVSIWEVAPDTEEAFSLIESRPEGISALDAFDRICGLHGYQIRGVAELNLPKDQAIQLVNEYHLEALKLGVPLKASLKHKYKNGFSIWEVVPDSKKILSFITNRPEGISASDAFEQIVGLQRDDIDKVSKRLNISINKLGLTREEAYSAPMTPKRFDSIKHPILEARNKRISDKRKEQIGLTNAKLPEDIKGNIEGFLGTLKNEDYNNISCLNREVNDTGAISQTQKLEEMRANGDLNQNQRGGK